MYSIHACTCTIDITHIHLLVYNILCMYTGLLLMSGLVVRGVLDQALSCLGPASWSVWWLSWLPQCPPPSWSVWWLAGPVPPQLECLVAQLAAPVPPPPPPPPSWSVWWLSWLPQCPPAGVSGGWLAAPVPPSVCPSWDVCLIDSS